MTIFQAVLAVVMAIPVAADPPVQLDTAVAGDESSVRDRNDPRPVTVTARAISGFDGAQGYAVHLKIGEEVQITSKRLVLKRLVPSTPLSSVFYGACVVR